MTGSPRRGTAGVASLEGTALWRLKVRLQFSGWLQFLPVLLAGLVLCLVSGIVWLAMGRTSAGSWLFLALGAAALARGAFEIVTVKLGWRPTESLPPDRAGLDLFDLMRSRRSCRSFQARSLTPAHQAELLEVARQHTQPDRLIGHGPIRLELVEARLTVWPTVGAHQFFVAIAPKDYDRLAVIDVGRALQKVVMHATRLGVDTCWIGPGADQRSVVAHLGARFDPERDHVICVCAVGYASRMVPLMIQGMNRLVHRRLPLSSLFFADPAFTAPLDVSAPPFAAYGRCYEICQWSPSSYNAQTTRCAAVTATVDGQVRPVRFDFAASTTSRYYAAVATGIWLANWELGCEALGLRGHFEVLTPEARAVPNAPELPRYDASWLVDAR